MGGSTREARNPPRGARIQARASYQPGSRFTLDHGAKSGPEPLPMCPRPLGVADNIDRCQATHMSPKQVTHDLPNRCSDHYTFPRGRHATSRTDAQITTHSQAGDMQLSEPMPSYSHVPKAGDTRLAEPMLRSLHIPKRATCNSPNRCPATHMSPKQVTHDLPNRCPDHYTFPSGRHATLRTDAQITTRSQAGDMQLSEPMPRSLHVPKRVTCSSLNQVR